MCKIARWIGKRKIQEQQQQPQTTTQETQTITQETQTITPQPRINQIDRAYSLEYIASGEQLNIGIWYNQLLRKKFLIVRKTSKNIVFIVKCSDFFVKYNQALTYLGVSLVLYKSYSSQVSVLRF